MTGIAISFLLKDDQEQTARNRIYYSHPFPIHELRENKLKFLAATKFSDIDFEHIQPDKNNNWINLIDNNFEYLIPVAVRQLKKSQKSDELKSIFQVSSNGISTNRDEWVYDFDLSNLAAKAKFFIEEYNSEVNRWIEYKKLNSYKEIRK